MNFWEMLRKFLKDKDSPDSLDEFVPYDPQYKDIYNYVITAHSNPDQTNLTISFFKPEQWEMLLSTSELTDYPPEDIVRDLKSEEVHQIVINAGEWDGDMDTLF